MKRGKPKICLNILCEDYLDAHLVGEDLYYLKDLESARLILTLGYRSGVKVHSREEFWEERTLELRTAELQSAVAGRGGRGAVVDQQSGPPVFRPGLQGGPLQPQLFDAIFWRKQNIERKELVSLVFVMLENGRGQEVVGKWWLLKSTFFTAL